MIIPKNKPEIKPPKWLGVSVVVLSFEDVELKLNIKISNPKKTNEQTS